MEILSKCRLYRCNNQKQKDYGKERKENGIQHP